MCTLKQLEDQKLSSLKIHTFIRFRGVKKLFDYLNQININLSVKKKIFHFIRITAF